MTIFSLLSDGYLRCQTHPEAPFSIYNCTEATQFERVWNEITLKCRGLILDDKGNTIACPFPKFFNLGETENQVIPNEPFEVFEKMDGSLGILYWWKDTPFIATRGSFTSEQAAKGTQLLHQKYTAAIPQLDPTKTYLFEIIYPQNQIVVDYGSTEALILLAIIDTASGKDEPLVDIGFPVVKKYDGIQDIRKLKEMQADNREGFVIKFESGLRYKVKFEEYLRLHRLVTQVSSYTIWEALKNGNVLTEILERVPDEFYDWVKQVEADLTKQYQAIEIQCKADFKVLASRKETALYFMTCTYPSILFAMLDNRSYADEIWKRIKPAFQRGLQIEDEGLFTSSNS